MTRKAFAATLLERRLFLRSGHVRSLEAALRNPDRQAAARYIVANASSHTDFHRFISAGDRYRDSRQWVEGFATYRAALDILPLHGGYLIQAGHCLKEMGLTIAAEGYYRSGLTLGAPLGDVEEHLLFVCRKNLYDEDAFDLRQLAGEVRDGNSRVASLPTLDELMGVAESYCTSDDVNIAVLVDLMRRRASFDDAAECLRSHGSKPSAPLRRLGSQLKPSNTFQFTLRTPLLAAPGEVARETPGHESLAMTPVPIADIRATARLFVAGQLDPPAPLFFGTAPETRDPANVSHNTLAEPGVSVIILNHNSADLALLAAGSVMASGIDRPYEILVVDNGSRAPEKAALQGSTLPLRLIDLPDNAGFGEGNNIAADAARGHYLLLLNSDAFLSPGAANALIEALETVEDAAAAGPIFRYPDGLLQEAGAFVCADGTTIQRGKRETDFDISRLPPVDVVDYVSASCLLIRRSDFMAVGGFAPQYHLAYSEDVDLCLRMHLLRKIVVMARDAVCFHIEGATTSAPEIAPASDSVAMANRQALLGSWGPYLSSRLRSDHPKHILPRCPVAPLEGGATGPAVLLAQTHPIGPELRYLMSLTAHAADGAILASTTACSTARLRNLESWLECPFHFREAISANDLGSRRPAFLLVSSASRLPQDIPASARALLIAAAPPMPGDPDDRRRWEIAERIDRFERILVPSRIAREALLSALACRSIPQPGSIDIVTPSIPDFDFDASPGDNREPWILTVTGLGEPGHQSGVLAIIDALSKSEKSVRNAWKLVVFGAVHCAELAIAEIKGLHKAAAEAGVSMELIVSPPPDRLKSLHLRSAIFIEARGFGYSGAGEQWRCDLLGIGAMRALAAGCRTLAWKEGAAAEAFHSIRAGGTFGSTEELIFRLQNPPPPADTDARERLRSRHGDAGLRARLQAVLTRA